MMIVWSTWMQGGAEFTAQRCHNDDKTNQVDTYNVVVVFVLWPLTVIDSVGSGNVLHLSRGSRQADQLGRKLCRIKRGKKNVDVDTT